MTLNKFICIVALRFPNQAILFQTFDKTNVPQKLGVFERAASGVRARWRHIDHVIVETPQPGSPPPGVVRCAPAKGAYWCITRWRHNYPLSLMYTFCALVVNLVRHQGIETSFSSLNRPLGRYLSGNSFSSIECVAFGRKCLAGVPWDHL